MVSVLQAAAEAAEHAAAGNIDLGGGGHRPGVGEPLSDHVHRVHLGAELVTYHTGHRGDLFLIGVE
jgi:hypothetical protein